ncbi:hypothetical protein WICANDRAFT_97963, partial [Wickerhamomyces anomalus NRRL Y-366-8]
MTESNNVETTTPTTVVIQQDSHSTLITLDDYISKALPYHLQRQFQLNAASQSKNCETKSPNDNLNDLKIPVVKNKDIGSTGGSGANDSNDPSVSINSILEKTYYNVETHSPESLDWFNVLVAQTINQFRQEALASDNIVNSLNSFLQNAELPDYLDRIKITELDIGDDYPIFSNC